MTDKVRVGNGCGFWGDNLDAPVLLAEKGQREGEMMSQVVEDRETDVDGQQGQAGGEQRPGRCRELGT